MKLAVYGTLKRTYSNHRLIERLGLNYLGSYQTTSQNYIMHGGNGFPYVYEAPEDYEAEDIAVEVFEFDDLDVIQSIDRLEGHPNFYERKIVSLNDDEEAWMYVANRNRFEPIEEHPQVTRENNVALWRQEYAL